MYKVTQYLKTTFFTVPIILNAYMTDWNHQFIIGFLLMSLINWYWWHGGLADSKYDHKLEFIEHYHWTLTMNISILILKILNMNFQPAIYGASLILWLDECFYQQHPFSIGSIHESKSDIIGLSLTILWFMLAAYTLLNKI
ncbi:MAG: hypothetical protein NDF56_06305 [archaeon GB-1845-036]|nr:hypothetical protein [Candidatus Culexmicrobium thermophilum]HDO20170.1 hypothetical protein [Candidatus Bathyarchaeota archaeon]